MAHACYPSTLGGQGRRITCVQEYEAAESYDCTTALHLGDSEILSLKKTKQNKTKGTACSEADHSEEQSVLTSQVPTQPALAKTLTSTPQLKDPPWLLSAHPSRAQNLRAGQSRPTSFLHSSAMAHSHLCTLLLFSIPWIDLSPFLCAHGSYLSLKI